MADFEKLGPYLVKEKLGQGGMGAVYRAEHVKSGEKAAVKVIASHVADQERFRRRFSAEIETLKKLEHPNIVGMTGYGEEQGHLFFAMQLIEGPSLQQHIKKNQRLYWDDVIGFGIDICSALKHAHDLGIVHRDLKPANLLMGADNKLMVTDFGIARLWGSDNMTAEGAMLGTADYMAPEQAGSGPITQRTDLYALGNVMYACLVGRPPFAGKQLTKVITSLQTEDPPPLDMILPDLPEELVLLIHHLLAKSPSDRPPTALSVGNRLRAMRAGLNRSQATQIDDSAKTVDGSTAAERDDSDISIELGTKVHLPTDERPTLDATIDSAYATGSLGDSADTLDSIDNELPESKSFVPQTHFRTVDQEERRRASTAISEQSTEGRSYEAIFSVVGLVALLAALVGGSLYALQNPSADSLYERIARANDDDELSRESRAIGEFLSLYPGDPRFDEVSVLHDQLNADRSLRRIRTRARVRGWGELTPAESAFLKAMMLRDDQPDRTLEQLQDWMIIYGKAGSDEKSAQRLIPAVQAEIELQQDSRATRSNDKADALSHRINASIQEMDTADERIAFLEAVVRLHGDDPWAQSSIDHAHDLIDSTNESTARE